jgi:protein TonB
MPVNPPFEEPTIPLRLQRPLAAAWISLGLHAALIALVQVAPPAATSQNTSVIEARLVTAQAARPTLEMPDAPPEQVPLLASSEAAEALPVAKPVASPPVQVAPPAATSQPIESIPATPQFASALTPPTAPTPAIVINSSVDLTYYSMRDVDVHPRALRKIDLKYPEDADRRRLSGKVRLLLKIEVDGRVSDIEVVSVAPLGFFFEESALEGALRARYAPAQKNGRPVRSQMPVEVRFDWDEQPQ